AAPVARRSTGAPPAPAAASDASHGERSCRGLRKSARRRENWAALSFLSPFIVGLLVITVGPIIASLYLSFTDYSLIGDANWIGLENYQRMLDDPRLAASIGVTVRYVFISVPLQLAMALGLAMILDKGVRGLPFYRSIFYLPSLLGGSVAIAIMWRQIFGTEGLVNQVLALFGVEGQGWISHPDYALDTLILLNVWTFGSPMVIFLAGLRQIPAMY